MELELEVELDVDGVRGFCEVSPGEGERLDLKGARGSSSESARIEGSEFGHAEAKDERLIGDDCLQSAA